MKVLYLLLFALMAGVIFSACDKGTYVLTDDELVVQRTPEEPKMVPFKGVFEVPPISDELITCLDESGFSIDLPKYNSISGNATHLGKIDENLSEFTIETCSIDLEEGTLSLNDVLVIRNKNGDGFELEGTSVVDLSTNMGVGHYVIAVGYGKFENATGSITTYGNLNNIPPSFTAEGMVTQPNH